LHTRLEVVFALYFRFLGAFFAAKPQKTGLYGGSAAMHGLRPCAAAAPRPYNPIARHQLRQARQRLRLPELMKKLYPGKLLLVNFLFTCYFFPFPLSVP
jgi:hypothetical protein